MRTNHKLLITGLAVGFAAFLLVACGEEAKQSVVATADNARDAVQQSAEGIEHKAGSIREVVTEGFAKVKASAAEIAEAIGAAIKDGAETVQTGADNIAQSVKDALQDAVQRLE